MSTSTTCRAPMNPCTQIKLATLTSAASSAPSRLTAPSSPDGGPSQARCRCPVPSIRQAALEPHIENVAAHKAECHFCHLKRTHRFLNNHCSHVIDGQHTDHCIAHRHCPCDPCAAFEIFPSTLLLHTIDARRTHGSSAHGLDYRVQLPARRNDARHRRRWSASRRASC